jgi:predicted enzyme related to lactoylglutathione lyase
MADAGQPGMRYTILSAGDRGMGGLMKLPDGACEKGARPGWVGYIGVPDTDAGAKRIVEAGGSLHMGPDDIPNVGRFAMLADPGGAMFYLLTPFPREDVPPPAEPTTPGRSAGTSSIRASARRPPSPSIPASSAGRRSSSWIWARWANTASSAPTAFRWAA